MKGKKCYYNNMLDMTVNDSSYSALGGEDRKCNIVRNHGVTFWQIGTITSMLT